MTMYTVYLTNHGFFLSGEYGTLDLALERSRKACFETTIHLNDKPVGAWSPISGYRSL